MSTGDRILNAFLLASGTGMVVLGVIRRDASCAFVGVGFYIGALLEFRR